MASPESARRLIVNSDDFGLSASVNAAVIDSHQNGILTTASLMVNEPGFAEAVSLARANPRLGVGLHLTLSHGHSTLPQQEIPGLVNAQGGFSDRAEVTGFKYFAQRGLRSQLERELAAQFEKFHRTGLKLDHVNGHLHFHLHPTIFGILMANAERFGIRHLRLTHDPYALNRRIADGPWFYRASHALIYRILSGRARAPLRRRAIRHTGHVFGLLQNARVDEDYILKLLPVLPAGDSELYSHPSLTDFKHEYSALVSPRVKAAIAAAGIQLIRYQDL